MKVGIDIDDTTTETLDEIKRLLMLHEHEYVPEGQRIQPDNLQKTEFSRRFFADYAYEMLHDVKLKPRVRENIELLHQDGHEIIFITARSNTYLGDSYEFCKEYLDRNGVYYDKLFTQGGDKLEICKREGIDLMIDDSIRTCERIQEGGVPSLLFTTECNINSETNCDRVGSWDEIYDYVRKESFKLKK